AMGAWTTAENSRTFFQVAAVALLWNALKRRSSASAIFSGIFAGAALFFSCEIGLYTIAAAAVVIVIMHVGRVLQPAPPGGRVRGPAVHFFAGIAIGAAPFLIYLAMRGALGEFFVTSFITVPRIIDAVWSLPFPDLVGTFRQNLNLHSLAD